MDDGTGARAHERRSALVVGSHTMAYLVLARKYRPQRFEDVVGQEHVTRTLQSAVRTGRLGHAFLFSGPRGVGKTTTARLLAKALNCEHGPTPDPCAACVPCTTIAKGSSADVLEIDGASHRGIAEVRSVQELVGYRPSEMRFRVCTIDEVHMLTNEAFNALLKLLEEPPAHVKFILATTEPHKVPLTIASRCQRYAFRLVPHETIRTNLEAIVAQEGATAESTAIDLVARCARGSLRDGQSLLDQALASAPDGLTAKAVQDLLGVLDPSRLGTCLAAILSGDGKRVFAEVDAFIAEGVEISVLYDALLELLSPRQMKPNDTCGSSPPRRWRSAAPATPA
ncbi:MAG: DNA polymerase III subunit gamma/tau [Candidatus Schekmanbacteria bacterium]|nr:DNA polymerase III subunit gamma/tau [Candidatus Schekmanbacteria bacterium]